MEVLREVEMNNAQYQALGRIEAGETTRDRQTPGEQYQAFRRRVMQTDQLAITFLPAEAQRPLQRRPSRLAPSSIFAISGVGLLLLALLLAIAGVSTVLALLPIIPALPCLYEGRRSVIQVIRMALRQLLR